MQEKEEQTSERTWGGHCELVRCHAERHVKMQREIRKSKKTRKKNKSGAVEHLHRFCSPEQCVSLFFTLLLDRLRVVSPVLVHEHVFP